MAEDAPPRTPLADAVGKAVESEKQPEPLTPKQRAAGPEPWESLDAEIKIERLRQIARQQDKALAELLRILQELMRHQHGADGRMVVPIGFGNVRKADDKDPDPTKAWL